MGLLDADGACDAQQSTEDPIVVQVLVLMEAGPLVPAVRVPLLSLWGCGAAVHHCGGSQSLLLTHLTPDLCVVAICLLMREGSRTALGIWVQGHYKITVDI